MMILCVFYFILLIKSEELNIIIKRVKVSLIKKIVFLS